MKNEASPGIPASMRAEKAVLGGILLDNEAYDEAAGHLKSEDFFFDAHRLIFARMRDLTLSHRPIDITLLCNELERHGELKRVGGEAYIAGLLDGVPDRPSIAHYVEIVKENANLRSLISAASTAIDRAQNGERVADVTATLSEMNFDIEGHAQKRQAATPSDFMSEVMSGLQKQATANGLIGLPTGLDPL